jgi:toxin ParE1/3/4
MNGTLPTSCGARAWAIPSDDLNDQADADLLQIYRYLAERNPAAAESLARDIDGKFKNLSRFPFIGRDRSTLAPGIRSIVTHPYVIFYKVEDERVVIARVLHGRRDIDAEFQR